MECGPAQRRFSDRAELYDRFRPGYPAGLIPLLRRETGLAPTWTVADVGAGTGISSLPFLRNGNAVIAVEPDAAMRERGASRLGPADRLEWREGTAEATGLPDASVDLLVAAQAVHWFDPVRAREELRRILRPGGWMAFLWNRRRLHGTPFSEAYERLLLRHGTDYREVRHDRPGRVDLEAFFGCPPRRHALPNHQELDLEGLEGRVFSCSYVPTPGDPAAAALLEDLRAAFRAHERDGRVRIEYETEVFLAEPGSRGG